MNIPSALTFRTVVLVGLPLTMMACGDVGGGNGSPTLDPPPHQVDGRPAQHSEVVVMLGGAVERRTQCMVPVTSPGLYGGTTTTYESLAASTGRPSVDDDAIVRVRRLDSGSGFRVEGRAPGTTVIRMRTACGEITVPVTVVPPARFTGGVCGGPERPDHERGRCLEGTDVRPAFEQFDVTTWYGPVDENGRLIPGAQPNRWTVQGAGTYRIEMDAGRPYRAVIIGTMADRDVVISEAGGLQITVPRIPRDEVSIVLCQAHPRCPEDVAFSVCILPRLRDAEEDAPEETEGAHTDSPEETDRVPRESRSRSGGIFGSHNFDQAPLVSGGCIDTFPDPSSLFYIRTYAGGVLPELTSLVQDVGIVATDGGDAIVHVLGEWRDMVQLEGLEPGLVDVRVRWAGQQFAFPIRIE